MNNQRVTAENALCAFYDIESLDNVFTVAIYYPRNNEVLFFYLIDGHHQSQLPAHAGIGEVLDQRVVTERILEINAPLTNQQRTPTVRLYNLANLSSNLLLASIMGLSDADSVNDPASVSSFDTKPIVVEGLARYATELNGLTSLRPVCDTDPEFDPVNHHPYLAGFNSFNYDSVMMALYLTDAFASDATEFVAPSAATMREYNNALFSPTYKSRMTEYLRRNGTWDSLANRVRTAMMASGRHFDVARLNELMKMVGVKRLAGSLGRQILESEYLQNNTVIDTVEGFHELTGYNICDCLCTYFVFSTLEYSNGFTMKNELLRQYPATVYNRDGADYTPRVAQDNVRRNRLRVDSYSAQFVARVVAPYSDLGDMETVSLDYPSEKVAAERGIERYNVLERARSFFYDNVTDPEARAQLDSVFSFYAAIEGKNFNGSDKYFEDYPVPTLARQSELDEGVISHAENEERKRVMERRRQRSIADVAAEVGSFRNCVPYFHRDGSESSCYVNFSIGGIHGAEYNRDRYLADMDRWRIENEALLTVQRTYPDPLDAWQAKTVTVEGVEYPTKKFLTTATRLKDLKERSARIQELGPDPDPAAVDAIAADYPKTGYRPLSDVPSLFERKEGKPEKLRKEYVYSSVAECTHEDFTSYYPNMLRELAAFYNPDLGVDTYAVLYFEKEELGRQMKAPGLSPELKSALKVKRSSVKLLLNSASGAGDTEYYTPIRMNNTVIAMRIIGQLFSWMIGQAQTFAGARIISTNTDGLYSVLDAQTNNAVLEEMSQMINVEIEPEPMLVVSKDSNNRLELAAEDSGDVKRGDIISASGSTLRCYQGPQMTSRLAHPAVLDYGLVQYLRHIALGTVPPGAQEPVSLEEPMSLEVAHALMVQAITDHQDPVHIARLFQNVLAASPTSVSYVFAADPMTVEVSDEHSGTSLSNPRALQNFNRVFVVKDGTENAVSLHWATAKKIPAPVAASRASRGEARRVIDPVALAILQHKGHDTDTASTIPNVELIPESHDVIVKKVNGVDASWSMLILNEDLYEYDRNALITVIESLDLDKYAQMLVSTFENSWRNQPVASSTTTPSQDENEDEEQPAEMAA